MVTERDLRESERLPRTLASLDSNRFRESTNLADVEARAARFVASFKKAPALAFVRAKAFLSIIVEDLTCVLPKPE